LGVYAIVVVASYLLGSIPFGYILVRVFRKQDIRATGSGNIGATNVARSGAKGLAVLTLLLDAGKGALAVWIAETLARQHLAAEGHSPAAPWPYVMGAMAALFAVAGHVFPVWLRFGGGKGVATAVGAFAVLAPLAVLLALVVFAITLAITRFVSLGSILGTIAFPVAVYLLPNERYGIALPHMLGVIVITGAIVIAKHHGNIRRLMAGTENKLGAKPVPSPAQVEKQA